MFLTLEFTCTKLNVDNKVTFFHFRIDLTVRQLNSPQLLAIVPAVPPLPYQYLPSHTSTAPPIPVPPLPFPVRYSHFVQPLVTDNNTGVSMQCMQWTICQGYQFTYLLIKGKSCQVRLTNKFTCNNKSTVQLM